MLIYIKMIGINLPDIVDLHVRKRYQAQIGSFWTVLFAGLTFAGLLLAVVSVLAAYWHLAKRIDPESRRLGEDRFRRLAELLNCRRIYGTEAIGGSASWARAQSVDSAFNTVTMLSANQLSPVAERSSWLEFGLDDTDFTIIGYALCSRVDDPDDVVRPAVFRARLVAGLVASEPGGWSPRARGPHFGMIASIVVFSACLSSAFVVHGSGPMSPTTRTWRDGVFRLERSLNLAGGVSSVFPMFFLVLAGAALVFSRLRDLYLFDQCMPHYPMPRLEVDEHDDPMKIADVRLHNERRDFEEEVSRFWSFVPRMARSHLAVLTLVVLFLGHYLLPLVWMLGSRPVDGFNGRYFDYQCVIMIMILFLFITLNTLRLALMWESVQRVMKLFLQLPLGAALGRMNARVSRRFFEAPETEGTRFDLIRRQADELARLCDGNRRVRDELERLEINDVGDRVSLADWDERWGKTFEERWAKLPERLRSINEASVF